MLLKSDEAAEAVSYPLIAGVQLFFSLGSTKLNSKLHSIRFVAKFFLSVIIFLEKFYSALTSPKSHLKVVIKGKKKY